MGSDLEDRELLIKKLPKLLEKYDLLLHSIIHKYIRENKITGHQQELFYELIKGKLNEKLALGKLNTAGEDILFKNFLYRIMENTLTDELRKEIKWKDKETISPKLEQNTEADISDFYRAEHLNQYDIYLKILHSKERNKFDFVTKTDYRMILVSEDILIPFPKCNENGSVEILSNFGQNYALLNKEKNWDLINNSLYLLVEKNKLSEP